MRQDLDSGAAAVEVTTIFDGVTIDQQLLWRGGAVEARDPTGAATVRLGDGGFELVRPDGERMAFGPLTRVTLEIGGVTFVVAGTTPPRRLPVRARGSWKERAGLLAVAVVGVLSGVLLQTAKVRRASWEVPEIVRKRIALLGASLSGGTQSMKVSADLKPPTVSADRPAPTPTQTPTTSQAKSAQKARAKSAAKMLAVAEREKTAAELESLRAQRLDDARKAVAIRAREAGVVGAMAHMHAQFLGSEHVLAAEFTDAGSIAIARADGASGANGSAGSASDGNSSAGGGSGSNSGGDPTGTLDGSEIGEAYGVGGLGLSGIGEGGGGASDGTIGLGNIGTIGHGGGGGTGYGYGSGCGGLGGRRASVPDVLCGLADVRGSCDKDLIRRVVRAHLNEVRFCYERALQSHPSLQGRAVTRFVIGYDGRVTSSQIASSTVSPEVDACVAQAIARWQFVPRCVGEVSYPFVFEAIRSAP
jgi:TonB family protein